MTIPDFLSWCKYGEGEWWLSRLQVKWGIVAAAEAARYERYSDEARWKGWRGGECDPRETTIFDDEDDGAAA